MKIIYTGIKHDRYAPLRGYSFEHVNFYRTLTAMEKVKVVEMPYERILEAGKKRFNKELLDAVYREKPDLVFAFMYTDELDPIILEKIKQQTISMAWFADDYWRFFNYSRYFAPLFRWAVTTSPQAFQWYQRAGIKNVIQSQWACNTNLYRPGYRLQGTGYNYDVSFVGQYKRPRAKVIQALQEAGIRVDVFGPGWPNGRVSTEEMVRIFSQSKISLNLNDRPSRWEPRVLARLFLKKSINKIVPSFDLINNLKAWLHFPVLHTHARPFEIAGCRGFVISGYSKGIENYYTPDKEMVFYRSTEELVDKIRYYLEYEREREQIAKAGYEHTVKEHTYEKRFEDIFKTAGLQI